MQLLYLTAADLESADGAVCITVDGGGGDGDLGAIRSSTIASSTSSVESSSFTHVTVV
jgi:hypothetical protein